MCCSVGRCGCRDECFFSGIETHLRCNFYTFFLCTSITYIEDGLASGVPCALVTSSVQTPRELRDAKLRRHMITMSFTSSSLIIFKCVFMHRRGKLHGEKPEVKSKPVESDDEPEQKSQSPPQKMTEDIVPSAPVDDLMRSPVVLKARWATCDLNDYFPHHLLHSGFDSDLWRQVQFDLKGQCWLETVIDNMRALFHSMYRFQLLDAGLHYALTCGVSFVVDSGDDFPEKDLAVLVEMLGICYPTCAQKCRFLHFAIFVLFNSPDPKFHGQKCGHW